jgi:hypothetical protein
MSSEPLAPTSIPETADSAEKGLLIAVLLLVLMGTTAILLMS